MMLPALRGPAQRTAALVAIGCLVRIAALFVQEGSVNDSTSRVILVHEWLQKGQPISALFGTQVWADGNYLLPAAILGSGGDLYWAVRVTYALIAVAGIALLYHFGRRVTTEEGAWYGALILALNPFYIGMSLDGAMGEIPALTLVLAGFCAVWDVRRDARFGQAVIAGVCFGLATLFRYESVVWAALAGIVALTPAESRFPTLRERRRYAVVAIIGVLTAIYPLILVARWSAIHGDPFYYLQVANVNQGQFFSDGQHNTWPWYIYKPFAATFWVTNTFVLLTPVLALVGFVGLARAWRRPSSAPLVIAYWLFFAVYTYRSLAAIPLPLNPRYALPLVAFVLPFANDGLRALRERWRLLTPWVIRTSIVASVVGAYAAYALFAYRDFGVLSRRFGTISPLQPGAYAGRRFANWLDVGAPQARAILSPCATSAYLLLARRDLLESRRVNAFSIYVDGWRVLDLPGYTEAFANAARSYEFAVFRDGCSGLGLSSGPVSDPFQPPAADSPYERHGLVFSPRTNFPPLRVFNPSPAVAPSVPGR